MKALALLAVLLALDAGLALGAGRGLDRVAAGLQRSAAAAATRDGYEAQARARNGAPDSAPTYSAFMSPITFTALEKTSNSAVETGHPVWVVTVRAFHHCEDCAAELPTAGNWVYSVVYDASSGREVGYCAGCALITQSRFDDPAEQAMTRAPGWLWKAVAASFHLA